MLRFFFQTHLSPFFFFFSLPPQYHSDWSQWSASCGQLTRTKTRVRCACSNGCAEPSTSETLQTISQPCPTNGTYTYTDWSEWSSECGNRSRTRDVVSCSAKNGGTCGVPYTLQKDSKCCPQNGTWSY